MVTIASGSANGLLDCSFDEQAARLRTLGVVTVRDEEQRFPRRLEAAHVPRGGAQREAASRLSACGARGGGGGRPDVGGHAAGGPGWKGSDQRPEPVEL